MPACSVVHIFGTNLGVREKKKPLWLHERGARNNSTRIQPQRRKTGVGVVLAVVISQSVGELTSVLFRREEILKTRVVIGAATK